MRRRIAGVGVALTFLALTAASGAAVASAACPNEAFRTGPSAFLPECRAYEQVTPVDKESGQAVEETINSAVSPSGDEISFFSLSAFAGAQGSYLNNAYIAARGGDAWKVGSIGGLQTTGQTTLTNYTGAVSPDLSFAVIASREALALGAVPGGSNLYLRDNRTGSYALILALADSGLAFDEWCGNTHAVPFAAADSDWSDILFSLPAYSNSPAGVYEYRGGALHLAVEEAVVATGIQRIETPNAMSADGSSFFYFKEGILYMYRRGQEALRVSEDEGGNPISGARFIGATPSGDIAFFFSEYGSLYRFEAGAPAGDRVTELAPPYEGEPASLGNAFVGEDGTHVYFTSGSLLTSDAESRQNGMGFDLYAWQGEPGQRGRIRYLGKSEENYIPLAFTAYVSPNGRFFGVQSAGKLTPDVVEGPEECPGRLEASETIGPCPNVFLYSYDADQLTCVSCNGTPSIGSSRLGGNGKAVSANVIRPVLDDGMVVFDSFNSLTPRDSNGARDTYAWQDGRTQLISSGTGARSSYFVANSADGTNIFFATEQPLVGQDDGNSLDLYDARIDGGLPHGVAGTSPCTGESSCRGGAETVRPSVPAASTSVAGAGDVDGACLALRGKLRAAKRRSHAFARRAGRADGKRAKTLRRIARREAKAAGRLGRRARNCRGGGR